MLRLFLSFLFILSTTFCFCKASARDTLFLEDEWDYILIGAPSSVPGEGKINLPATLDSQHKSVYNPQSDNTSQLRREFSFSGTANYSKYIIIPEDWKGKNIFLNLERTKPSSIKIDGKTIGSNSRISSNQRYDLGFSLTPGLHILEISVNNSDSIPPMVARSSHAASEATQTNWNGILGNIFLEARSPFHIQNVVINDNVSSDSVLLSIDFSQRAPSGLKIKVEVEGKNSISEKIKTGSSSLQINLPVAENEKWSHYSPRLFNISFSIVDSAGSTIDECSFKTGFRNFSTENGYFLVNDNPIFLRGTLNAAVFPLTAYAPTDIESWRSYFQTLKEYGLNHVRFHSWTPPDAAFQAADELGFYLMVELPIWGELDRDLKFHNKFLKEELKGIMEEYSHHPSFVMFSTGNELWGDISLMGEYMKEAKSLNPRILATYGSNIYLGMNGEIGGEDFVVSSKTSDSPDSAIRGSLSFADSSSGGYLNSHLPNSTFDFSGALSSFEVPVISHEIGQYQSYPNFNDIEKFTGILKPDNLLGFKNLAQEAGTLDKSQRFNKDSGKWAAKLYKAEMEAALRTDGLAGFEMFGLQDYPGQGTALVGILNPFMESKGFVTPEEWRQVSSDIVLLAKFPKFIFSPGEFVKIPVSVINFTTNSDSISEILWRTEFDSGLIRFNNGLGRINTDGLNFKVPQTKVPHKMNLYLAANDGKTVNNYEFWIFPENPPEIDKIRITDNMQQALRWLDKGEKVILCPDTATIAPASIEPLFTTDFFNYRMFRTICEEMKLPVSPGTLGLSIDSDHPALSIFPTSSHTDWHWYSIIMNSRPLIIDRLPKDFNPIIEVIDNVERNYRLALLLECNVEKGKLMILPANLNKLEQTPEGRWLIYSLKNYMNSKEFKPSITLSPLQLENLLTKPSNSRLIQQLRNPSYTPPS